MPHCSIVCQINMAPAGTFHRTLWELWEPLWRLTVRLVCFITIVSILQEHGENHFLIIIRTKLDLLTFTALIWSAWLSRNLAGFGKLWSKRHKCHKSKIAFSVSISGPFWRSVPNSESRLSLLCVWSWCSWWMWLLNVGHVSAGADLQNIKRVNVSVTAERPNRAHSSVQSEADFIIDKSDSSIQSLFLSICLTAPFHSSSTPSSSPTLLSFGRLPFPSLFFF